MVGTIGAVASNQLTQEYTTILSQSNVAGVTQPTYIQQLKQNKLLNNLKINNHWNSLDVFYVFANDGGSSFGLINWKQPSLYNGTLVNSPTFTFSVGFTGGGTSYVSTNWNPSMNAINYSRDSGSIGAYEYSNLAAGNSPIIGSTVFGIFINPRNVAGSYTLQVNHSNNVTTTALTGLSTSTGLNSAIRTGSAYTWGIASNQSGSGTTVSQPVGNGIVRFLAGRVATTDLYSARTVSIGYVGGNIKPTYDSFKDSITTYMQEL